MVSTANTGSSCRQRLVESAGPLIQGPETKTLSKPLARASPRCRPAEHHPVRPASRPAWLGAGHLIDPVVEDQEDEIRRGLPRDGDQRAQVHDQPTVASGRSP